MSFSIYYNFHGKKTGFLGNILIAFCASATFLYGAVLTSKHVNAMAWTIFLLAFLSNSAREFTKSIADAEGDRMGNVRSLAIIHSARTAAITAATLYLLTAIVGPLITRRLDVSIKLLPTLIFLVSEAGFVYSAASILNDTSQENALRVNKRSNVWMMLVLVAIALNILCQ
jgi:4-hydroxybenzoate polyprenyltransferase